MREGFQLLVNTEAGKMYSLCIEWDQFQDSPQIPKSVPAQVPCIK